MKLKVERENSINGPDLSRPIILYGKRRYPQYSELGSAIQDNEVTKLSKLIGWGAKIGNKTPRGDTALHLAAKYNSLECAELLIMFGADLNERDGYGRTALMIAAYQGYVEIVKLLLRNKADIYLVNRTDPGHYDPAHGLSAKDYAQSRDKFECLTLLLDAEQQFEIEIAEEELKKSSKVCAPD